MLNMPSTGKGNQGGSKRIAIIGAGAAGAMAAHQLLAQGHLVRVFDKSRGAGGRMATRRIADAAFDHGAQYLTLRDPALARLRDAWVSDGLLAAWEPVLDPRPLQDPRWVPCPGMNALPKALLAGVPVDYQVTVAGLDRHDGGWSLRLAEGVVDAIFDVVIVAVPAPQALALLPEHPPFAAAIASVRMAPCWAVLATTSQSLPMGQSLAFEDAGPLTWVARNSTKPARAPAPQTLVLHASEDWSHTHLEAAPAAVAAQLWDALADRMGMPLAPPDYLAAHRWRYARVPVPLGRACLWDEDRGLGVCGDWCLAGRVEAALQSGAALAARVADAKDRG